MSDWKWVRASSPMGLAHKLTDEVCRIVGMHPHWMCITNSTTYRPKGRGGRAAHEIYVTQTYTNPNAPCQCVTLFEHEKIDPKVAWRLRVAWKKTRGVFTTGVYCDREEFERAARETADLVSLGVAVCDPEVLRIAKERDDWWKAECAKGRK